MLFLLSKIKNFEIFDIVLRNFLSLEQNSYNIRFRLGS